MATSIKGNPVLYGEDARAFLKEIEKKDRKGLQSLTPDEKKYADSILKSGNNFKL